MPAVFSKMSVMMSDEDVIDPRYENCVFYIIKHENDENDENIYVGHSVDFKRRIGEHNRRWKNEKDNQYNRKVYQYIRENGGMNKIIIQKLEDYPCKNKHKALPRENYWLEYFNATLNCEIPGNYIRFASAKEVKRDWCLKNKEHCREYAKKLGIDLLGIDLF